MLCGRPSGISSGFRLAQVTLRKHRKVGRRRWYSSGAGLPPFPPGSGWRKSPCENTGRPAGDAGIQAGPAFRYFLRVPAGASHPAEIPEGRPETPVFRPGRPSAISSGFRVAQVTLRKHRKAGRRRWYSSGADIPVFPPGSGWRKSPCGNIGRPAGDAGIQAGPVFRYFLRVPVGASHPSETLECRCLNWSFFPQIIFSKYFSKLPQDLVLLVIRHPEKRLRGVCSTLSHPL